MGYVSISGPSGCGKDTVIRLVQEKMPNVGLSISCTTRPPKTHSDGHEEKHGVDYFFMNEEEYHALRLSGGLLEYTKNNSGWYGTPIWYLDELKRQGKDTIFFNVDMRGAVSLRSIDPATVSIYILPPSLDELYQRLLKRGRETNAQRKQRMIENKAEMLLAHLCHYLVLNDEPSRAADEVCRILAGDPPPPEQNRDLLASLNKDFIAWRFSE